RVRQLPVERLAAQAADEHGDRVAAHAPIVHVATAHGRAVTRVATFTDDGRLRLGARRRRRRRRGLLVVLRGLVLLGGRAGRRGGRRRGGRSLGVGHAGEGEADK